MSRYDNWERLVGAVLKREQLWQLFHEQSRSPSLSSGSSTFSFSFGVASLDDVPFGFSSPEWPAFNQKEDDLGSKTAEATPSNILDQDQSPVENLPPSKNVTFTRFWKRALRIEVPKPQFQRHGGLSPGERLENSQKISPKNTTSTPVSRVNLRTGRGHTESQTNRPDDSKQESHPLPLPPGAISNSAATSFRSPERAEMSTGWKKGKLIARGALGDVYIGFNSETGEMCAMKEFNFSLDEAKSKQAARMFEIEISVLSRVQHPNIVQCYGSETVGDNFYIFYEYVSGGSIHMILQEYGELGESAIRTYTQQILSTLAYLHSQSIVHGNIRGASILVETNGSIKLASFSIEQRIAGQSRPLLLMDSIYWMAPEVIMKPNAYNQAIDIWSLGCTILEMAKAKPPYSQYDGIVAMFKVTNGKELPTIPKHLSDECKDFVRRCLQLDPQERATAAQLLKHPFVRSWLPLEKQIPVSTTSLGHPTVSNAAKSAGIRQARSLQQLDAGTLATSPPRPSKSNIRSSDIYTPRNTSAPVSPVGSPLGHPRSPQQLHGHMSPPTTSRPCTPPPGSPPPLTGDTGAIPYCHHNQSPNPQETFHNLPRHSTSINSPPYWDPKILQGRYSGPKDPQELPLSDNNALQKQFGSPWKGQLYEQLSLADRVSEQLLKPRMARV